jgi:hypothetical protein
MSIYCMKHLWLLIFCTLSILQTGYNQSCETSQFSHYRYSDIKNILEKYNCQNCHHRNNTQNVPWHFTTYQDIIAKGKCGHVIDHGSPQTSLLVDKLNQGANACGYNMPLGGEPISTRDLLAIENWILVGAPEFCITTYTDIKNVLEVNNCKQCHQSNTEWRFDQYEKLFVKTSQSVCNDPVIVPFQFQRSLLYQKIAFDGSPCGNKMPVGGQAMAYEDVARIRDWINAGAFQSSPLLPVILTDFFAEYKKDKSVLLYWQSSTEVNTGYYLIEHSYDGIHFQEIGVRTAKSQSNQLVNYDFYDYAPGFGNQYYRLKIVDNDGQFTYSPTRAVRIKNTEETLRLYPSTMPSNQTLFIEWLPAQDEERTKIHIMDILGREVYAQIIYPGINSAVIPQLNPGLYYAVIRHDVENYFVKKMIMIY